MAGLYFEDFEDGQLIHHPIRRTITESDNTLFSVMTMNPAALHLDHHYAQTQTPFGKPLVNSLLTLGVMIGISVHDTTLGTTVANLGMTDVVFPKPVFHGDTIKAQTRVISKRASKSRAGQGIVEFDHTAFNQHGDEVARCRRQALMLMRPHEDA